MFYFLFVLSLSFFLYIGFLILFHSFCDKKSLSKKIKPVHSVIIVKNMEESIEGIIRSVVWKIQNSNEKNAFQPHELIIIDLGSTDNTFYILKTLAKEYPFIHPMTKTSYTSYIDAFD